MSVYHHLKVIESHCCCTPCLYSAILIHVFNESTWCRGTRAAPHLSSQHTLFSCTFFKSTNTTTYTYCRHKAKTHERRFGLARILTAVLSCWPSVSSVSQSLLPKSSMRVTLTWLIIRYYMLSYFSLNRRPQYVVQSLVWDSIRKKIVHKNA